MIFSISNIRSLKSIDVNKQQKKTTPSFKKILKKKLESVSSKKDSKNSIFDIEKNSRPFLKKEKKEMLSENMGSLVSTEKMLALSSQSPAIDFEGQSSSFSTPNQITHQMIHQMADYLVAKSQQGISHMEVILSKDHFPSFIHETKILIDHFDTHPHSFNIQLLNPNIQTLKEMQNHLGSLILALNNSLPAFEIHLLPPAHIPLNLSLSERKNQKRKNEKKVEPKKIPS